MSKNSNRPLKPLFVRILAGILAGLLILSCVIVAIELIFDAGAEETDELSSYAFHSDSTTDDLYVAVAIRYSSNTASSFCIKNSYGFMSPYGYAIGEANVTTEARSFTPFLLTDNQYMTAVSDINLKLKSGEYTAASSESDTDIGSFNVDLKIDPDYVSPVPGDSSAVAVEIWDRYDVLSSAYSTEYKHVFKAYIHGEKTVRIGAFATYSEAEDAAGAINAFLKESIETSLKGITVSVASPETDGVMLIDTETKTVVFEYCGDNNKILAFCARQYAGEDRVGIMFYGNEYTYDGAICFRRAIIKNAEGMILSNLVDHATYTDGVIPAEIYTNWPVEELKAFAATAHTFVINKIGSHMNTYFCDVWASSDDQNYSGMTNVNENVKKAGAWGKDYVITYEKEDGTRGVVTVFYNSTNGGTTIDEKYAWNVSEASYIDTHPTMWEDYHDVKTGFWKYEVSATELCTRVKAAGLALKGTRITDVSYTTTEDSTYVYSITFTDDLGYSATAVKTQKINTIMGQYSRSANFVIAKGSIDYSYDDVISNRIINLSGTYSGNIDVKTANETFSFNTALLKFFSALGLSDGDGSQSLHIMTANGKAILVNENDIPVTTLPDENGDWTYVSDFGDFLVVSELRHYDDSWTASSPDNFLIVGKGFGHGVGISQYGAYHLANAGATAEQILRAYYTGVQLEDYNEWMKNH